MKLPTRDNYLYQSRYCEENIWHLCQRPEFSHSDVLVIASRGEFFPILCQREAAAPDEPVLWDYHVVLLWHEGQGTYYILDFDTTLPFCTPAEEYFQRSLIDATRLKPAFIPLLRVVSAQDYATSLRSDRRHMKTASGWLAEPPAWPPISASDSNLAGFTDMKNHRYGRIATPEQLLQMLSQSG